MIDPKVEPTRHVGLRLRESTVAAIRKSGQNTSDWLRQAAQTRLDQERGKDTAHGKLEKQIEGLQKEIARLQQSESIVQAALAEMRKMLAAIQHNQAELQRALVAMENGIGHTLAALGPTLLAAIDRQIDQHAQAALDAAKAKEERLRALVPPAPPRTRL